MRFPEVRLSQVDDYYFFGEFPSEPEKGAFLSIAKEGGRTRVKVDRFSRVPFYYTIWKGQLLGATRLSLLLSDAGPGFPRKLDGIAALQFVRTNSMIGERTLIEGILRIPYGCELIHDEGENEPHLKRYWDLPAEPDHSMEISDALHSAATLTDQAISQYVNGYKRVGMHLSGGMDSRVLLGGIMNTGIDFKGFTYGVPKNLDCQIAEELAKRFDFPHNYHKWTGLDTFRRSHPVQVKLTDGMQALIHGHGLEMHEEEGQEVDTIMIGHFLDMFLFGHMYDRRIEKASGDELEKYMYGLFNGGPCSILKGDDVEERFLQKDYHGVFRESILPEIRRFQNMEPEKQCDALYLIHHGLRRLMPQAQSASFFLDATLPGLQSELFDFNWSVPARLRKYRKFQEKLLREKYPHLVDDVRIVMDNCRLRYIGNVFGRKLVYGLESWARQSKVTPLKPYYSYYGTDFRPLFYNELYPWIQKEMANSPLFDAGLFKPDFLRDLVNNEQTKPRFRGPSFLSAIFSLHAFIQEFIEESSDAT